MAEDRTTVRISNIPRAAIAKDLFEFFESTIGKGSVFACEIVSERKNWKSRGFGRVQFETLEAKSTATRLSQQGKLLFKGSNLSLSYSFDDVIVRPVEPRNRVDNGILHTGFLVKDDCMCVLESWEGVKAWIMPERKSLEFWVGHGGEHYKLELQFGDVSEACGCCLDGEKPNAVLLKLRHAPKIYQKISGPNIASKFSTDRYHICKEDFEFLWVRTTDFSSKNSIGQSSSLCWEIEEGLSALDFCTSFPYYSKDLKDLTLEEGEEFCSASELVPLVRCQLNSNLAYEILFQLNSLVHTQKISLAAVDDDLIEILSSLDVDTAMMVLQKLHKLQSTCFEPVSFIKTRLHILRKNSKNLPSSSHSRLTNHNVMSCHRVLVTPSKIYCLGPELESSNYVVKKFASYASDFIRVTFVEEDWCKLWKSLHQELEVIPDVEVTTDGVGYCFSDGIGKISLPFARQVAQKCGLSHTPSAFQIRYGGYKGVIAVDRNSFRKLSLRNSMLKFESNSRMLNVTKWSDSMPCYLNREIVTLLTTLGVEDKAFEAMQDEQLRLLDKMLTSREAALDVLESINPSDIKSILVKMLLQGYEPNSEPYLSMMLQMHHDNLLSDLRSRCRIFVPKGRILIGCLDETSILNYGQVYVRITMNKAESQCGDQSFFQKVDETTAIVIGKVVVTKNPCLHPGDVRVLEAVYEVALEEKGLVDCIVFPQKGERPHPNECSGGDLDGDLYFISWDENLIPCQTTTPMDYIGRRPRLMDHDVTLEEIQKFFVDYMINDTLGTISTAHLVLADREPSKAMSPKCLQLAALHSMAVDFAKTGAPAEMPRVLKPREFPDFMERWEKPTYTSQGVLGKLYRATINSTVHEDPNFVWSEKIAQDVYDHDLEVDGFEAFVEIAKSHKEMYLDKISTLMIYYAAESEDEILSGNLRNRSMYLLRDNRRYGETKDRILVSVKSLHKEAKGWFESSCKVPEQQKMASAWYHVTYHPTYCKESINCLGFPWIVGDILLNIKSVKSRKF
ncbi:hypothetical protein F0562_024809 [Nyssa sinensis]|uniref:RNA-dependent RNA polymerase n=1 Tax=Nyssa sinensis TaxID=561372 RepID=A0A5J5BE52_9ASTE|nr:hypothetical protein F0562_024809 [Nyssa sinensis]